MTSRRDLIPAWIPCGFLNMAVAATKAVAPASFILGSVSRSMPPSTSSQAEESERIQLFADLCHFGDHLRHELLARITGVNAHHQHQVRFPQKGLDRADRRLRVQDHARPASQGFDLFQRAEQDRGRSPHGRSTRWRQLWQTLRYSAQAFRSSNAHRAAVWMTRRQCCTMNGPIVMFGTK